MEANLNIQATENEIDYTITLGDKIVDVKSLLVNGLNKDDLRSLDSKMQNKTNMINKMISWGYPVECIRIIISNENISVGQ